MAAVAAPITKRDRIETKRDRVVELHYITRGAQKVKDVNFKVSQMNVYYSRAFMIWLMY